MANFWSSDLVNTVMAYIDLANVDIANTVMATIVMATINDLVLQPSQ